jgi:hypothetical protein
MDIFGKMVLSLREVMKVRRSSREKLAKLLIQLMPTERNINHFHRNFDSYIGTQKASNLLPESGVSKGPSSTLFRSCF